MDRYLLQLCVSNTRHNSDLTSDDPVDVKLTPSTSRQHNAVKFMSSDVETHPNTAK
jgi:hypothetical protein